MLMATPVVAVTTVARTSADEVGAYIIRGRVVSADGQPLAGATVRVPGTTRVVGTNSKGEFELTVTQGGTRHLTVTHIGYTTATTTAEAGGAPVSVTLQPTTDQFQEAVVTGTRVERALKDVPVITRVIGQAEIEQINPQNFTNLLQYALPGIQIQTAHGTGGANLIYQGMASSQLVFLIDGERVNGEGASNQIDFNRINVDEIERIEVVRGAASAFYDSNAQAGVINIITKRNRRPIDANVFMRYAGRYGEKFGANFGINRKSWTSYTTFGWRQASNNTISDNDGIPTQRVYADSLTVADSAQSAQKASAIIPGYRILDLSQRFTYDINDHLSAEAKVSYHANRPSYVAMSPAMLRLLGTLPSREYYTNVIANVKLHYQINANHRLDFSYQHDVYNKNDIFLHNDSLVKTYSNRQNDFRLIYTGVFGSHTLGVGVEALSETLLHKWFTGSAGNKFSETRWSVYAQNDWRIIDGLNLVVGVRADKGANYNTHFTPKVSVLYRPVKEVALRVNYSDGYHMPFLKDRKMHYRPFAQHAYLIGNDSLKAETSRMISGSVEYSKNGLNLTISAFRNTYKGLIAYKSYVGTVPGTTEVGRYSKKMNIDETSRTTGLEVTARYRTLWGLGLNAAYNYVDDHKELNGYNISTVRPHTITFGADYRHKIGKVLGQVAFNSHWGSSIDTYTFQAAGPTNPKEFYFLRHYNARTYCTLHLAATLPRGIKAGFMIDNLFNYRDKAISTGVQRPDLGRSFVANLSINLADAFGW